MGFTEQQTDTVAWIVLIACVVLPALVMFRDTFRGGMEASMRYLYNKASSMGLSSFTDDEINDAERARHIELFKNTHVGGLYNEGNTCFINSVVQSLASCYTVANFVKQHSAADCDNFSAGLADLITNLNQIHSNSHGYSTGRLMQNIGGKDERWNRLDQEDAQEFFQQLLSTLEKDWKRLKVPVQVNGGMAKSPQEAEKEGSPSKELKLVTPFDGVFATRVGCLRCGDMEGIRKGVISSIDLTLNSPLSLTGLLDQYCEMETIPGVECYRCTLQVYKGKIEEKIAALEQAPNETLKAAFQSRIAEVDNALTEKVIDEKVYDRLKCNSHKIQSDKTKQSMLAQPMPEVLMIHINRSVFDLKTGYIRKNYSPVEFPIILDMAPYITDPLDKSNSDPSRKMKSVGGKFLYTLKAAVVHYGSANFGHYVCFRKFDGFWWRISDDTVNLTTEAQVLGAQGVFMLFYERLPGETAASDAVSPISADASISSGLSDSCKEVTTPAAVINDESDVNIGKGEVNGTTSDIITRSPTPDS